MPREACRVLITDQGGKRLLLAKRADHDFRGGTWSVFGGKIDIGETPEEAIARETFEEAGLTLQGLALYRKHEAPDWVTYFYTARATGHLLLNPDEHSAVGYFGEEDLTQLVLAFDHLDVFTDYLNGRR